MRLESLNDDMKLIDCALRSATLKDVDNIELTGQQSPNLLPQGSPRMKSLKRIFVKKP